MDKISFKKFIERVQDFRNNWSPLGDGEKDSLKKSIMEYVEMKPIREPTSEYKFKYKGFKISLYKSFAVPALLIVVLFGGAGISAAAEESLPGDFLYPVKIHLNENIRDTFAVSDKSKESWSVRKVERRFEELSKLTQRNELNEEKGKIIENELNKTLEEMEELAQRFETKNNKRLAQNIYIETQNIISQNQDIINGDKLALATPKKMEARIESTKVSESDNGQVLRQEPPSDLNLRGQADGKVIPPPSQNLDESNVGKVDSPKKLDSKKDGVQRITILNNLRIEVKAKFAKLEKRIEKIESNSTDEILDSDEWKSIEEEVENAEKLINSNEYSKSLSLIESVNSKLNTLLNNEYEDNGIDESDNNVEIEINL